MEVTLSEISDFLRDNPDEIGNINVLTRHGYKKIEAAGITEKDSVSYTITFECGNTLIASPYHKLFINDEWGFVKDIVVGDFGENIYGKTKVKSIFKNEYKIDLYDIQVKDVNEYYANDIVSHNSTFSESISFALYGKSFRETTKPKLVNSINKKECLVQIEFETNGKTYKVFRGIKPNVFEIYENDVKLLEEADAKIQQEKLQEIIGIKFDAFKQIVVLGNSNYRPFMKLKAGERRQFIEDILDTGIFAKMLDNAKNRLKILRSEIVDLKNKIETTDSEISIKKNFLDGYNKETTSNIEDYDARIKDNELKLEKYNSAITKLDVESFKEKKKFVEEKISDLSTKISLIDYQNKEMSQTLKFLKTNDNCPTCGQIITGTFKKEKMLDVGKDYTTNKTELLDYHEKLNELNDTKIVLKKTSDTIISLKQNASKIENTISYLGKEKYKLLNKNSEHIDTEEISRDIQSLLDTKQEYEKTFKEKHEVRKSLETIGTSLSEKGMKQEIIKKYIPLINEKINEYLKQMDFFIDFQLDENFKETIHSRKIDVFAYENFSEGERKRIDMALMFTWRDIKNMIQKTKQINLLVLDEIFDSSLDMNGVDSFMGIIENLQGNNVFVISHRSDNMIELFEDTISFKKVDGFSQKVID